MKHRPNQTILMLTTLLLTAVVGCGESGPQRYRVSGTVTLDGQSLPKGEIVFFPIDGGTQPDASPIAVGKFLFQSLPGKKRVEIRAERLSTTNKIPVMGPNNAIKWIPAPENYIPAPYNTKSELCVEVQANGSRQYDFQLSSSSRKK